MDSRLASPSSSPSSTSLSASSWSNMRLAPEPLLPPIHSLPDGRGTRLSVSSSRASSFRLCKRDRIEMPSCQWTTDCGRAKVGSPSMVLGAVAENIGNKSGRKGELGGAPYSSSFGCGQPEALKERHLRGQTTPTWALPFCCCYSSQRSQRSRRGWWEWRDRGASAGREVGVACHRL